MRCLVFSPLRSSAISLIALSVERSNSIGYIERLRLVDRNFRPEAEAADAMHILL